MVWIDFNNDGNVDYGESGIPGVLITLNGPAGSTTQTTDANGLYMFSGLAPGAYALAETQTAAYGDGNDALGTVGGQSRGNASNDLFSNVVIASNENGINYNYGELPPAGSSLARGGTATIGFWHNKNGQKLIRSLNGGPTATQLGNWLAGNFPNLYGSSGADFAGKSNDFIASYYLNNDFNVKGQKLDAQVLATAFAIYATNSTLAGGTAASYGFGVSTYGVGNSTFNVGSNGAAFGVANNTTMRIIDILTAADAQAVDGVLYNGNTSLRNMANSVFDGINTRGDIG
jgi:hypothetical protein